jgi:hypothetical protein
MKISVGKPQKCHAMCGAGAIPPLAARGKEGGESEDEGNGARFRDRLDDETGGREVGNRGPW